MGMYDTIICKDKLPINHDMVQLGLDKTEELSFQTKDFHENFINYIIKDACLFEVKYKNHRFVEDKNHFAGGYMTNDGEYLESYPYHGVVNMYDYKEVGKWDCWIEYNLTFTGGKMTNATLAMFRKTDNTERKKELEEFYKESNRISNLWYNKYFLKTKFILYIRKNLRDFLWYVADSLLTLSQKI